MNRWTAAALCGLLAARTASAEDVTVATYNIEDWAKRFDAPVVKAWAATQPASETLKTLVAAHDEANDKGNWEVACVLRQINADVVLLQEACGQADLDGFNKRWMDGFFAYAHIFPSNTGREQNVGILVKPGFKILNVKEDYYQEPDTVAKDWLKADPGEKRVAAGNKLFARGPGFVLLESPGGHRFWVGVNQEKSKHGETLDVAKWRDREAIRIHAILVDLQKAGPADVIFGGDMNDTLGLQPLEKEAGGDSIALLQGPPEDGVDLATRQLAENGEITFAGYFETKRREFIDHLYVTRSVQPAVQKVFVFKDGVAPVASDHYPVVLTLKF